MQFAPNDVLTFCAGQQAGVDVSVETASDDADDPGQDVVAFRFAAESDCTTAWATVLPGDTAAPSRRDYYSEPDQAPYFAQLTAGADALDLSYYALTRSTLPDDAGPMDDPYRFPLVPYQAMTTAADGFGADPAAVAALEFQLFNRTRQARIQAMAAALAPATAATVVGAPGGRTVYAVTPQGYQATFADGQWTGIQCAQTATDKSSIDISFTAAQGEAALPTALQNAFLTNQQFLVITRPDNLGTFKPTIEMDNWPFTLDLSKNTTVGDYRNVLIFKSGQATVAEMARHPDLWTGYGDFNDIQGDPNGTYLSTWLVNYLDEAKALYDDGDGVESLGHFCSLIDDPKWNGFIALRVDVNTGDLPAEIEALLAGIDKSLFAAHHLGNRINHIAPGTTACDPYTLDSAFFGLVRYQDPLLGDQAKNPPAIVTTPQDLDFKVLTLEAVFEKAILEQFSNKSLLILNKMFGDTVQPTSADGTAAGANNVVLIGAYHDTDGVATYTFQTGKGVTTDFYPASNAFARNQVTKTNMTVVQTGGDGDAKTYRARFGLWGNFRLLGDPVFDLLSYEYLGYHGLAVDMTFTSGGGDPAYAFNSAGLVLALAQTRAFDPASPPDAAVNLVRTGSLIAQFPLKLKAFVNGSGDRLPDDMGYRQLDTTAPSGIALPSPGSGGPWYALSFNMNLGGQGAMGSNDGISAELMLTWTPGGNGYAAAAAPQFKLSGPGGVSLSFDLEGVIKFGAKDIVLNKIDSTGGDGPPDEFVLVFESIALTVLSLSYPPQGTTNVVLFGDTSATAGDTVDPTLAWFGGYVAKQAGEGA